MQLSFSFFNLESSFDWLKLYTAEKMMLGQFTGTQLPPSVSHKGPITVHFTSDSTVMRYFDFEVEYVTPTHPDIKLSSQCE